MLLIDDFLFIIGHSWRVLKEHSWWSPHKRALAEIHWHWLRIWVSSIKIFILAICLADLILKDFKRVFFSLSRDLAALLLYLILIGSRVWLLLKAALDRHRDEARIYTFETFQAAWSLVELSNEVLFRASVRELNRFSACRRVHVAILLVCWDHFFRGRNSQIIWLLSFSTSSHLMRTPNSRRFSSLKLNSLLLDVHDWGRVRLNFNLALWFRWHMLHSQSAFYFFLIFVCIVIS